MPDTAAARAKIKTHRVKGDAKKQYIARRRGVRYCSCGCRTPLPEAKKPSQTRAFIQGHDAILKSRASKIVETGKGRLPKDALKNLTLINFLQSGPLVGAVSAQ